MIACACVVGVVGWMVAQPEVPRDWIDERVAALAEQHSQRVRVYEVGRSRQGRPIHVLELADAAEPLPEHRPAVLIVAGAHGQHRVGVEAALGVVEQLASAQAQRYDGVTLYVVPALNRDGLAFHAGEGAGMDFGRTIAPYDADGDGRVNEDPGEDINGDGLVTMMRIAEPAPQTGLTATHVIDPDEPRLMRAPEADKGERATHAYVIEGVDNDGDGRFNEDGPGGSAGGGVLLDRNFPALWPEFRDGAGRYPLSEPESRALVEWVLGHPNVVAVVVYGMHDTLVKLPPSGQYDPTGEVPTGIEKGDEAQLKRVSERYRELTGQTGAPSEDREGSLVAWAYGHAGLYGLATPVWVRPDLVKSEDEASGKEEAAPPEQDGAGEPAQPEDEAPPEVVQIGSMRVELTAEGIRSAMAAAQSASEAEQRALMEAFRALPAATQARLMELGSAATSGTAQPVRSPRRRERGATGAAASSDATGDDARWLTYSDEQRDGEGFVPWQEVEHPQLGTVEVGGFVPGFRVNPPAEAVAELIEQQSAFAGWLLEQLPQVRLEGPSVSRVGAGLWRVTVRLINDGPWPTRSAIGQKARRLAPELVVLDVEPESIVSGARIQRMDVIAGGGGWWEAAWLIAQPAGELISVEWRSPVFGNQVVSVRLED